MAERPYNNKNKNDKQWTKVLYDFVGHDMKWKVIRKLQYATRERERERKKKSSTITNRNISNVCKFCFHEYFCRRKSMFIHK